MKKKTIKVIVIVALVILFGITISSSFARYGSDKIWNYYLESQGLYLTSDYLDFDKKNINTLWDGESVHFNVKNYTSNDLITDFDIRYTVKCEVLNNEPYTCKINGTNNNEVSLVLSSNSSCVNTKDNVDVSLFGKSECELKGYKWNNIAVNQDIYFDLVSNNSTPINTANVKITVRSTSPYKKTMTGTFSLFKNKSMSGQIIKQISDNELYDELVITNSYGVRKCLLVSFNSSNRILSNMDDIINPIVDNNGYINSFKVIVAAESNKKIRFYNKDLSSNYSTDDFVISESSGCF